VSPPGARIPPPGLGRILPTVLILTAVTVAAGAAQPAATVPQSALHTCVSIAADAERLACYDRVAGRAVPGAAAPAAEAPPLAPAASSAAAVLSAPVPPRAESFGLYEAEHPKAPPVAGPGPLEARVFAVGTSAGGHMTVSLEGGAVWELDDADPLLAAGQSVTIARAAFGSYIMHTPTRRTHRVRRLH
jgi:hypothetical protein